MGKEDKGMGSRRTEVRTIRVTNEVAEWIKRVGGRNVLESVYELVKRGELNCYDGDITIIKRSNEINDEVKELKAHIKEMEDDKAYRESIVRRLKAKQESNSVLNDLLDELREVGNSCEKDVRYILNELCRMIDIGAIEVSRFGVSVGTVDECPFNWRSIVEACDEMNLDYDEAVKKCIERIYRG